MRYGLRVSVIAMPAHPTLTTPQALAGCSRPLRVWVHRHHLPSSNRTNSLISNNNSGFVFAIIETVSDYKVK